MLHYTPRQRSLLVQVYALANLVLFFALVLSGLTVLAWADAILGVIIFAFPRLRS